MRAFIVGFVGFCVCLPLSQLPAVAAAGTDGPVAAAEPMTGAEERFLVGILSPRLATRPVWATGFGGYDSARQSAVVGAGAELAVTRWLALRAGFYYVPQGPDNDNVRPNAGLRVQLLRQNDHAVDGAVGFNYRQERYVEDGGLLEAVLSIGRSGDAFTTFANLAYAQDPEGDDFEGQVRAAALYRALPRLNLGLQASYQQDLGSTDERRLGRVQPDHELIAGPVATYTRSGWVLVLQVGVDALTQQNRTEVGAVGVAGVGTSF